MSAFVTLIATCSTVEFVAASVSSNNPRLLSKKRGMGVEKVGMMTAIAAAKHKDHRMMSVLSGRRVVVRKGGEKSDYIKRRLGNKWMI